MRPAKRRDRWGLSWLVFSCIAAGMVLWACDEKAAAEAMAREVVASGDVGTLRHGSLATRSSDSQGEGCQLDHSELMVDSSRARELADIALEMRGLADRAAALWQREPWERNYPPFREWTGEFFTGAASVARLSVSLNLTDPGARLLLAQLEWTLSKNWEAGLDRERELVARHHAVCAVEYAEAVGDRPVAIEARRLLAALGPANQPDDMR